MPRRADVDVATGHAVFQDRPPRSSQLPSIAGSKSPRLQLQTRLGLRIVFDQTARPLISSTSCDGAVGMMALRTLRGGRVSIATASAASWSTSKVCRQSNQPDEPPHLRAGSRPGAWSFLQPQSCPLATAFAFADLEREGRLLHARGELPSVAIGRTTPWRMAAN